MLPVEKLRAQGAVITLNLPEQQSGIDFKNKRQKENALGFAKLQKFVAEAAQLGVHQKIEQPPHLTNQQWANRGNILGTYVHTHARQPLLGQIYGLTRERVRQIIKEETVLLYEHAPLELQEKYNLTEFSFNKPNSQEYPFKRSEKKGNKIQEVRIMLQEGKSPQEIEEKLGVSRNYIARLKYRNRESDPSHVRRLSFNELENILRDPELSVAKRQQLLNKIGIVQLHHNPLIISTAQLSKEAGLYTFGRKGGAARIVQAIQANDLPARLVERRFKKKIMRYGYAFKADKVANIKILKEDPSLEDLRVPPLEFVGNLPAVFPSTYQLKNTPEFDSLRSLLGPELMRELREKKLNLKDIFHESLPITIFLFERGKYARTADGKILKKYVTQKLTELHKQ